MFDISLDLTNLPGPSFDTADENSVGLYSADSYSAHHETRHWKSGNGYGCGTFASSLDYSKGGSDQNSKPIFVFHDRTIETFWGFALGAFSSFYYHR